MSSSPDVGLDLLSDVGRGCASEISMCDQDPLCLVALNDQATLCRGPICPSGSRPRRAPFDRAMVFLLRRDHHR